jgi:PAS domain S-box-containing protein
LKADLLEAIVTNMDPALYRSVFEHSLDGILVTTPDGAVLQANPQACRMLARTEGEIRREGRAGIMVQDDKLEIWLRERMKTGAWRGEINFRRKDGVTFPAEASSGFFVAEDGVIMTVLSFQDISIRKTIEKELHQAHENLENRVCERTADLQRHAELLDLAYDAIIVRDTDGRITFWNRGAEEVYGWDREEALGRASYELLNPRGDRSFEEIEREVVEQGHWEGELRETRKDGSEITVASRWAAQKDVEGRPMAFLETNSDVTEQVRLGQQLRETQKLEAIGTLSSGIAHDFNNILAAVIGFAELALGKATADSRLHRYLSQILKAGMRGSELVRNILAFARTGEQTKQPVNLSAIIKESIRLLRASVPATIEIRQDFRAASDTVLADAAQIQQIIMNLATNAVHAMAEKGGLLEITLTNLSAPSAGASFLLQPGDYVVLTVRDTGTGIPERIREHLFEPFFTTKERGEGTGLGLAMVHGIVKSHGGEIIVSSTVGQGSTFTVYFPTLKGEETAVARKEAVLLLPRGSETLLLVDDEPALVEMETEMLEELGYRVARFINTAGALGAFRDDPEGFDLVITDQTMPRMTGIELARKIHEIRPDIPIILISGYADQPGTDALSASGIAARLQKPLVQGDIAETVRSVLDSPGRHPFAPFSGQT